MKWLKKLWDRLSRKDYVRVRNKKLGSTIHMLTDCISEQQQELIATDLLIRTFKSGTLKRFQKKYEIDDAVLSARIRLCQDAATLLFNNLSVYQPLLRMGVSSILDRQYVKVGYVTLPDLLFELIEYGPTPESHQRILNDLIHHMDLVRKVRRDLFTCNE